MATTNPGGRKSDKPMRDALMLALTEKLGPDDDRRKLRVVADKAVEMALEGDREMIKLIFDRTDGKAVQPIVGDDDHAPLTINEVRFVVVDNAADVTASDA
jgi:hypothetical protein